MGRVVGREPDSDSVTRNYANAEPAHAARQLRRHLLPILQRNLVAATAEDLVDASGRLYQVISSQIKSFLHRTLEAFFTGIFRVFFRIFELRGFQLSSLRSLRRGRRLARGLRGGEFNP